MGITRPTLVKYLKLNNLYEPKRDPFTKEQRQLGYNKSIATRKAKSVLRKQANLS